MSAVPGLFGTPPAAGVDPTTASGSSAASLAGDLNQFLTLLTTQLQNQDPLDPLEGTEFTAQLVQFAGVEQEIFTNSNLETLIELQQTSSIANLVDFIGNEIEYEGQEFVLENGTAELGYTLPPGVSSAEVIIVDPSTNITIFNQDLDTGAGQNSFIFNGIQNNGQPAPDGEYLAIVSAFDSSGNLISNIPQTAFGQVSGAGVDNGETSLFVGSIEVNDSDVISVRAPTDPPPADPVEEAGL